MVALTLGDEDDIDRRNDRLAHTYKTSLSMHEPRSELGAKEYLNTLSTVVERIRVLAVETLLREPIKRDAE